MRFLSTSLVLVMALLSIAACNSKSSSSSSTESSAAASAPAESGAPAESPAESSPAASAAGGVPSYPGAVTQASGSSSNMGTSAAGTVMSTDDSFDKVYAWYQQNLPSGSEKSHVTAPVETAVFTMGEPGQGQTSVTITASGGKTLITVCHVKM